MSNYFLILKYSIPYLMRKNHSKLDRLPQPLTISRKLNLKSLQDPNPYRIGQEIKQNRLSTSQRHTGLAEMKQQLLQIKDDMIKLFATPNEEESNFSLVPPTDVLYETLKQQLGQMKSAEEKLRRQIEKSKGEHSRTLEELQLRKDQKIEQMRRQKESMKTKYQKVIANKDEQICQLKKDIYERQQHYECLNNTLGLEKSKYQTLALQLENLQNTVRQLKLGNSKQQLSIIEGIESKKLNIQLSTRIQSLTFELQNYKALNQKLQQELKQSLIHFGEARNSISALESNQLSLLERLKETEDQGQSDLNLNNQQLNSQRMEIINLELSMNDLQEQNYVLTEHNKYIKGLLMQTEQYIKALETELEKFIKESKGQYNRRKKEE